MLFFFSSSPSSKCFPLMRAPVLLFGVATPPHEAIQSSPNDLRLGRWMQISLSKEEVEICENLHGSLCRWQFLHRFRLWRHKDKLCTKVLQSDISSTCWLLRPTLKCAFVCKRSSEKQKRLNGCLLEGEGSLNIWTE